MRRGLQLTARPQPDSTDRDGDWRARHQDTFSSSSSLQLATSMEQTRPTGDTKNLGIQLAPHLLLMLILTLHCRLTGSESLCKFGSVPRDLDVPAPPSCLYKHG